MAKRTIAIVATVAGHLRAFHLPWVQHLRSHGNTVIGIAGDINSCERCKEAFDEVVEIPFSRNAFSARQMFRAGGQLRDLCLKRAIEAVHFHTPNAAFWGRLGLREEISSNRCKVIYTAHGFHFHKNGSALANFIFARAERLAGPWTHALLTINAEDAKQARRFQFAPGGFHFLLPGAGVDVDRFNPERFDSLECHSKLASSLGLGNQARFVLMVAEFSPGKRHRDALKAFAELNYPGAHLILAGMGAGENRAKRLTRRLGLEHCVHFLGYRGDIPELLAASDVIILPSGREGLPVGIIEAMAMEKPVVVASARGSIDLVKDGCGWAHPIGDCNGLSLLIRKVLNSPREAAARARNAREKVLSQYSWQIVRQNLSSIYKRLGILTV